MERREKEGQSEGAGTGRRGGCDALYTLATQKYYYKCL